MQMGSRLSIAHLRWLKSRESTIELVDAHDIAEIAADNPAKDDSRKFGDDRQLGYRHNLGQVSGKVKFTEDGMCTTNK